ncbi:MAG: sigma-70 family RNA polymerase sigma factor [Phycisphaerales bacterium]
MKENTETTLVQAALNGDADSFSRLCKRYYSAMVAIAYSQLCDRDLAEDAAQEAFFVAFRDLSKLKKASHFSRWLAKICRNIATDMAKARISDKLAPIQDCGPASDERGEQDNVEVVRSIISELPVKNREVIYLRYYSQMSYQQISNVLGISQEAVNGRLRRAKRIVAKELLRRAAVEVNL